jgi:integrase
MWREEFDRIERGKRTGRQPMTFGEAADRWWQLIGAEGQERDLGPPGRPGSALHWLVQQLGDTPLHKITGNDIDALIIKRRERLVRGPIGRNGKPLYRRAGGRTINMLKAKQRWNVDIPNMPTWSDHLQQVGANTPRVVTFAEQATLDQTERPWLRPIREFAILTGLRLTECASVRWSDVNFETRIRTIKTKGNRKQDKKPRQIPLTDPLIALLRSLKGQHPIFVFTYVAIKSFLNPATGRQMVKGERYP